MKKMMFLLAMSAVALGGCDWGSKPEKPRIEMSQELKDYTFFKTGSYWIYKDSASQEIDSVYITKMEDYEIEDDEFRGYCTIAGTSLSIYSTFYQKGNTQRFDVLCNVPERPWTYWDIELNVTFFCGIYGEKGKERPIQKGDYISNTVYDSTYVNYTILGRDYLQVKYFKEKGSSGNSWNNFKRVFYAPHVGIIKKETKDGKVWQLVKYQVVQ